MNTVENVQAPEKNERAPKRPVLQPPVECLQHRIYVWSSPAPYAVLVDEQRSWQPR